MYASTRASGLLLALVLAVPAVALAQSEEELAKQLANPIADLISVPFQNNFDFGGGPDDDAFRYTLNIQPVVPISLSEDWNVISRTILPIVYQDELMAPDSDEFGLSDTTQSLFFSPVAPGPGGLIWGVGPVLLLPTATDDALGREQWGAGPTAVALQQRGPWTVGALANHIWSFAGEDDRADVDATFLQPFAAYTWPFGFTLTANTESTYDWEAEEWRTQPKKYVTGTRRRSPRDRAAEPPRHPGAEGRRPADQPAARRALLRRHAARRPRLGLPSRPGAARPQSRTSSCSTAVNDK